MGMVRARSKRCDVLWVKPHVGLMGNKTADEAANRGRVPPDVPPELSEEYGDFTRQAS